ncbi:MAG TPA: hypothetical protein VHZ51_11450 [Ktedonobacteraceae bacterium]|nr:hypothetical protein [Ktedonobacteraceae bacterium]
MARLLPRLSRRVEQFGTPEVADHFALAHKHVEHRPWVALCVLAEVVAVVGVARRGQQPQPPPAALVRMSQEARHRSFGHDREIDPLPDVLHSSVQAVKHRSTGRARPLVVEGTREHEVVDHQRIETSHEQLRQPHLGRDTTGFCLLEDVVLRNDPTGRKPAAALGDRFGHTAQFDLPLQEPVARRSVVSGFIWKRKVHHGSFLSIKDVALVIWSQSALSNRSSVTPRVNSGACLSTPPQF